MIGFDCLRIRLIENLRYRIRNGEVTERGLALKAGISQPHLHNLLKGVRALNAARSDQLLTRLGLTALDLFDADELRTALRGKEGEVCLELPVLRDRLGPGLAWPDRLSPFERVQVPLGHVSRLDHPAVARLGEDDAMRPVLDAGDLVLLDPSEQREAYRDPEALFAVDQGGHIAVRWLRCGRARCYLVSAACRDRPSSWESVSGPAESIVRARVIPLRSTPQPTTSCAPLPRPRDIARAPALRSAAS
jgi:hypothetical protein